jgi:phage tail sheath gpL-like
MALPSVISPNNKSPGVYLRVSLGVGARSSGANARQVALFGNKTATGTAPVAVEQDVFSEDEARGLFGAGSELFLMAKQAITANLGISLKAIAVAESAGAAATGTVVYATPATGAGTGFVTVLGEEVEFPIASGDTPTVIGANAVLAVNAKTDWPVTAANATGTVTLTCKNKGPRGNFIAVRARVTNGIATTCTPPASGYLTGGATSDDPQPALDVIAAVKRRYLVAPYSDATQLGKFKTHVDAEDEPEVGHRCRFICASLDTLGNATTLATGLNAARGQMAWHKNSDLPPSMLAAGLAARLAARESLDVGANLDGDIIPGIKPSFSMADRPINSQLVAALNNGITPLMSADDGSVSIVRSITLKSRDALGNADYRVLDTAKVAVSDECADRHELLFADRFAAFKASQDPADGEFTQPITVTPSICRDASYEILSQMEAEGLLEAGSVEARKGEILWELSTASPGRFVGVVPVDCCEGAHQFCGEIKQIG